MPRKVIDYSKGLIYKIVCKDLEVKDLYVGSTTDLCRRRYEHKKNCTHSCSKHHHLFVYRFIREHGDWDNWDVILVELYPCGTKEQLLARERHHIEQLGATLNKNIPSRTPEQYREENSEVIAERAKQYRLKHQERLNAYDKQRYQEQREEKINWQKQYYVEHKEKIREKQKKQVDCECGGKYVYGAKARHFDSAVHLRYLQKLPNPPALSTEQLTILASVPEPNCACGGHTSHANKSTHAKSVLHQRYLRSITHLLPEPQWAPIHSSEAEQVSSLSGLSLSNPDDQAPQSQTVL